MKLRWLRVLLEVASTAGRLIWPMGCRQTPMDCVKKMEKIRRWLRRLLIFVNLERIFSKSNTWKLCTCLLGSPFRSILRLPLPSWDGPRCVFGNRCGNRQAFLKWLDPRELKMNDIKWIVLAFAM